MYITRFQSPLLALALVATGCGDSDTKTDAGDQDGSVVDMDGGEDNRDGAVDEDAGDDEDADVGEQSMELMFEARVGDEMFGCDKTYSGMGTTDADISPMDFRLYVHNVRMMKAGGGEQPVTLEEGDFQHEGVALLDFEDGTGSCANGNAPMNVKVVGTVPAGDYDGVAFTVGVPEDLNHADPAAAGTPLNLSSLHWGWAAGYKFVRIDFMVDSAESDTGAGAPFSFHLGSTSCQGDPSNAEAVVCDNPNRPEIALSDFDPAGDKIVIDYAELVDDDDMNVDLGGKPGCLSGVTDGECEELFPKLGLDLDSGEASGTQTFFHAETR